MTYILTPSEDHEARGLAKLLEQFKDKALLEATLAVLLRQVQALEDCAWEAITYSTIDDAFGAGLDILGRIVGRPRFGLGDDDYRQGIRAEIRIKKSRGRAEDLIQITRLSIPEGMSFTYSEPQTHTVLIELEDGATFDVYQVLFQGLRRAKQGGVRLYLIYSAAEPEDTFTFATGATPEASMTQGYGDVDDASAGGVYAGVLSSTSP